MYQKCSEREAIEHNAKKAASEKQRQQILLWKKHILRCEKIVAGGKLPPVRDVLSAEKAIFKRLDANRGITGAKKYRGKKRAERVENRVHRAIKIGTHRTESHRAKRANKREKYLSFTKK